MYKIVTSNMFWRTDVIPTGINFVIEYQDQLDVCIEMLKELSLKSTQTEIKGK